MRKIEKDTIAAVKNKRNFHMSNMRVEYLCELDEPLHARMEQAKVYLFNKHIGTYLYRDNEFHVNRATLQAYPTATTKSRLRAFGVDVFTSKGKTYLNGGEV